jgi:NAD(P)-dependent dehydrogenase (short-subunit alcohol dehydrogenase family)
MGEDPALDGTSAHDRRARDEPADWRDDRRPGARQREHSVFSLEGRRVLVTGASGGIGAALAEGFAARGAVVGICARRTERLAEVLARCERHGPGHRMWTVDLADLDGVADFARRADDELGGIDVLVNNAGIPKRRRVTDLDPATVDAVMAINYSSPIRLTLALLPAMLERAGARGGARIQFISSVAARLSPPAEAAYAASKAAVTAFAESMVLDLDGTAVSVHVVNPGVIDTDLFHLPDNDPLPLAVEALPVDVMVQPVVDQLVDGTFEIYVPAWFADVTARKFPDVGSYLAGSAAYLRAHAGG